MFLIDKPYISDFLKNTLRDNQYGIISTKEARELINDDSMNWIPEQEAVNLIVSDPNLGIYLNSENAFEWLFKNVGSEPIITKFQQFKNKASFRDLLKEIFPDFFFKSVEFKDLKKMSLDGIKFPFVIKPSLGFFSLGVNIVYSPEDWHEVIEKLNIINLQDIYPKEVLDTSTFIIEEYINGEEYAIDCYFDQTGEPVILNILHHRFSSGKDLSHRVYSTSRSIISEYRGRIEKFLKKISVKTGIKSFPSHIEIRVDSVGEIHLIEANPLRFGGWCTTGDLAQYAYGINAYKYFIENRKPDWDKILSNNGGKIYSIIVLNNNSGIEPSEIASFNYKLLQNDFENILDIRKLEISKYSIFGFAFTETSTNNETELDRILVSDLKKYIITRS
jgi:hypothetical protein